MLDLYRASAGSGKTYMLAKKYIWYYITIRDEHGKVRLRTDAELADSARHILAITFTNKATNEMQMRIVNSLFELSIYPKNVRHKVDESGRTIISKPTYMQDFIDELGSTPEEISRICAKGLELLLENYSDFNVSTIDSFFQQVLRTFAYEADINDSYQVELDSDYLSQVGVDETLQEIDNNGEDEDTRFWIKTLIDRTETGKWNIFSRSDSSFANTENPYKDFINSVKKMETEQYKRIRGDVETYFADHDSDLRKMYTKFAEKYDTPVREAYKAMRNEFRKFDELVPDELKALNATSKLGKLAAFYRNIRKLKWNDRVKVSAKDEVPDPDFFNSGPKPFVEYFRERPQLLEDLRNRYETAYAAYLRWKDEVCNKEFAHWDLYSKNLPFFALFSIVTRKRMHFLEESNAIELAETSMILQAVIGDSDTPFLYERLGTRLNHYLIDEFQDTSAMQWHNLSPLVHESMSRENGNLIIGDAKQSIYRFRNADPELITKTVPAEFGDRVDPKGMVAAENTNYRSDLHVVQFNNSFFEYLVDAMDGATESDRMKFGPDYANVVQTPNRKEDKGYVEVRFMTPAEFKEVTSHIPELIRSLIDRGYALKDIAVLVSRHTEGESVINALIDYNLGLEPGREGIRFVSEQSLKVASSRAVNIVLGVLRNMARGSNPEIREGEERRRRGVGNWTDMMANFKFYQMEHPGVPLSKLLEEYFASGADFNALSDLLSDLPSLNIPAVVEAVIARFVPEDVRRREAIFIAAFQDLVLEYCEGHPTDIGSFLKWWERKKTSASISSPEDTDAVQIVTVHKSKGLEFKCVIVPYANWEMDDEMPNAGRREWTWVEPGVVSYSSPHESFDYHDLPPYLPVETSPEMEGTIHDPLLKSYYDLSKRDRLNSAYVAFTRAENELYIFTGYDVNKCPVSSKMGIFLYEFLKECGENRTERLPEGGVSPRLDGSLVKFSDDGQTAVIGSKPDVRLEEQMRKEQKDEDQDKERKQILPLDDYESEYVLNYVKFRKENEKNPVDTDVEEELDPRSEGTLKHKILEYVRVPEDLHGAVRHLCMKGEIPMNMADGIEKSLSEALSRPDVAKWFDKDARVINERPVLRKEQRMTRPDRVILYPDNTVVVVDYKFGKIDETGKYRRQIADYVRNLAQTGNYESVAGFIWYVNEGRIEHAR